MSDADNYTPIPFDTAQIYERIESMLRARGESWTELSDRTGIDERTFRRWKNCQTVPQSGRVREVAAALELAFDELTHGLRMRGDGSAEAPAEPQPSPRQMRDPWKPASEGGFVGRHTTMQALLEALEQRRSANVVGDRRIGKSSVLKTWEQRARAMGYTVVSVSGEMTSGRTARALVKAITGADAPDDPDGAADALLDWTRLRSKHGHPPMVLCDEFDDLASHVDGRFFQRLRGMVGAELLVLVLATCRHLADLWPAGGAPPFDNLVCTEQLGLLEPEAADTLAHPRSQPPAPEDVDLSRLWCGRHPFYVKLLAHHLQRAQRDQRPREHAVEVFRGDAGREIQRLWRDHLDPDERAALRGAVRGEAPPARTAWGLQRRGILTEEGRPFGEVLTRWVQELG
jgi:hypothetical protein